MLNSKSQIIEFQRFSFYGRLKLTGGFESRILWEVAVFRKNAAILATNVKAVLLM